ncbi:MAG: Carbohydrate binding family 6, partial [Capsulimonas sp.]|nr:Carbohydrate binding family 6 [Capsulimonas sp.]
NLYSRNFAALKSYSMTTYGIDVIWVPETMGWDGNARHTDDSSFTKDIYSTGTEAAENMYLRFRYSNDSAYLSSTAYPFMKEVAKFYASKLSYNSSAGKYFMAVSNAHETYWDVKNAITDLAAVRSLFPHVIQVSQQLGLDSTLRTQWQNILNNLSVYPVTTDGSAYLPNDPPAVSPSNFENITSELLWPYGVTGIGATDYAKALNGWNNRPNQYNSVWAPDAIQAARLGLGDDAYQGAKAMLEIYQTNPNGRTNDTNGEFEYLGVHLSAINESLLQSYNDKIRVFPAAPSDTSFNGKFTLLAKGGFLVSSEREGGEIKYIALKSLYGNGATIENPWGTQQAQIRRVSDNAILLTTSAAEFNLATAANAIYVIERTAKLLSSYTHVQLTGTANSDAKVLEQTSSTLGAFAGAAPDFGKYEAERATLATASISSDFAASNGHEVTGLSPGASVSFSNVKAGSLLDVRYCTANNPGKLSLYVNGALNQSVTLPSTNSWSRTYATVTVGAAIPQGAAVKLQVNAGDAGANLDYIQVRGASTSSPYGGTPWAIPGVIQSENFDLGGEGVGYHDGEAANNGGQYRTSEGVDIETASDTGGSYDVGFTSGGEWMKYTVNVATAGVHIVSFRVAAPSAGGSFHLQTPSGTNLTGSVAVPSTGGWQTWTTITANVTLPAGVQTLMLYEDGGGYNLNFMSVN